MSKVKVLVTVKTYPVLSEKYTELACTAGFREGGGWVRLYPIPFRMLDTAQRYKKYQWIEADLIKSTADPRPESYKVGNLDAIAALDEVNTAREWDDRRRLVLGQNRTYTNLTEIIKLAHSDTLSLVIFKPTEILDFIIEEAKPWGQDRVNAVIDGLNQGSLFENQKVDDFKMMPKLPYKFSFRFKDDAGKESTLMIEDWEVGQLYWSCERLHGPVKATQMVKQKYLNDFARTKDLYFFLGTTREWHIRKALNPFVIIGTFHPPFVTQTSLF